jgi:spore cortex protein
LKIVKTVLSIGVASGLLMGCATNGNNGNGKNNVSPVRYNPNNNNGNNVDRVSYRDNMGPDVNNRDNNLGNNVNYNRNNNNVNDNNNNNNIMKVADEAADRVSKLKEVQRANVIVTGNNAYVAVMLTDRSRKELPNTLKDKISKEVKKADNDIDNVYVSLNPDFFDRMTDYARELRNGHPVKGLYDQISGTIKRVFPTGK